MTIRTMFRCWFGEPLRLGASPPNFVSSPPAPSSSGRKLFSADGPIRSHLRCRPRPQSPRRTGLWPQGNKKTTGKTSKRTAPNRLPSVVGTELHSPSNMFLGLALRSKSVLRNTGEYASLPFVWKRPLRVLIHHRKGMLAPF